MNYKFRDRLIELSQVVRYHGNIGPVEQNIASHSWGVAWLITEFHSNPSANLIKACLEHDLPEHLTSDVSYIAKVRYPALRESMDEATLLAEDDMGITSLRNLTEEDVRWLKWADLVEGALWCRFLSQEYGFKPYERRWKAYSEAIRGHMLKSPAVEFYGKDAVYFSQSVLYQPLKEEIK